MQIRKSRVITALCAALVGSVFLTSLHAQAPAPPKPASKDRPAPPPVPHRQDIVERALQVAPNVNVRISCISQARVTVNGWRRNEIRVLVRNGTGVGFQVYEADPTSKQPVWVMIGRRGTGAPAGTDCISGERIDIEAPFGASFTIAGRETEMRIDSLKKVTIKNLGGNVALRNISGGISAETFEGDVSVEDSSGQITLKTSTGNILAFGVKSGQIGEAFRVSTSNGAVTLQNVAHRQIEASSVSGAIIFDGVLLRGGIYGFKTSNGEIRLSLPANTSSRVEAWYGYGTINSEIPLKTLTENISSGGKSFVAMIGNGGANLNLTTNSGRILISKQPGSGNEKP